VERVTRQTVGIVRSDRGHVGAVAMALLALYLIWGSTYFAILVLLEVVPPFVMAGLRFVLGGAILIAIARAGGAAAPDARHWLAAVPLGAMFFLGGNGGVVWSETRVPSGIAALLIAMVPLWIAVLETAVLRQHPTPRRAIGVILGLCGVGVLVGGPGQGRVDPLGAAVLLVSALCWASGTLFSKRWRLPESALLASGMEMLAGGGLLLVAAVLGGEMPAFLAATPTVPAVAAFLWLLIAGSIIGFTLYLWLLRVSTPAVASTYAYVNPIVAVLLGYAWANEPLGPRVLVAGVLIVGAVVLITTASAGVAPGPPEAAERPAPCADPGASGRSSRSERPVRDARSEAKGRAEDSSE
jgi:drug/metabolite transporter (DMT)-like permease